MRHVFLYSGLGLLLLVAACGGDDSSGSGTPTGTDNGGIATLSGLQGQLAAVLLQQAEVPDGLEGSAPDFSTNEDLAGPNQQELQRLVEQGRQLGADVQFIPTSRMDPNSPLRGGIGSSASVYTNTLGASESFQDTVAQARSNNWEANYPAILGVQVTEIQRPIGDESIWLRIAGKDCTPAPASGVSAPVCNGPQHEVIIDNVVFRVGRVRAYLQVSTLFPMDTATADIYQDEVSTWAEAVVQHARDKFPTA